MAKYKSISARFTAAFILAAAVMLTIFVGLVLFQMNRGLNNQADQLAELSEEKLAERLDADAKLARARVRNIFNDAARRLAAIAKQSDTNEAIASRNVVAISELFGPAANAADIDAIIAIDTKMRVIGANNGAIDLLAINSALASSTMREHLLTILSSNDQRKPQGYAKIIPASDNLFSVTGLNTAAGIGEFAASPTFDDFGDVTGAIIGLRVLKKQEPALLEFAELTNVGVIISFDKKSVVSVGANGTILALERPEASPLLRSHDGNYRIRCVDYASISQICAAAPVSELSLMRDELVRIGLSEGRALIVSLVAIAALSLLMIALIAHMISRQVTRPLAQITRAVSAVARGDCSAEVIGADRRDEVGDIARAVLVLQISMEERDHLRHDVVRQNEILRQREDELKHQNLWFNAALNNMSQGLCMFDAHQRLIVSNQQYQTLYDLPSDVLKPGTSLADIMERSDALAGPVRLASGGDNMDPAKFHNVPAFLVQDLADGRVIAISRRRMSDDGWVATYEDVTERQQTEAHIAHLASHDALTELPNRTLFREHLEQAFARQKRYHGEFALHCLDLNEFKTVNDTLGHLIGDKLLCIVAERLRSCIRESDVLVRLGGDEFAVIQMGLTRPGAAADMAQRMIDVIQQPYNLDGHQAVIGVSIGVAMAPRDGAEAELLLKNADLALYRAKLDGRNTFRFFEAEMDAAMRARRELEMDLRQALSRGEFEPHYQPLIHLATNRIIGFEALLRWHHPTRGMVSPTEFIPIAEEIGIIAQVGEWVLRRACLEAMRWPDHCKVAVNISAAQIKNRNLTQVVVNALATSGLPASRLEIEVTESVVLEEDEEILSTLRQLKELGVRFSMDDFGTGYSSLSCLRSFPFDKIKIDQSFVRDMETRADCAAIVRAVNNLAQTLGMTTTAEGVETQEQLDMLRLEGCTEVQGYFLGRPMPASAAATLVGSTEYAANPLISANITTHPGAKTQLMDAGKTLPNREMSDDSVHGDSASGDPKRRQDEPATVRELKKSPVRARRMRLSSRR